MSGSPDAKTYPMAKGTALDVEAPELSRVYAEAIVNAATKAGQVVEVLEQLDQIVDEVLRPFPQFADLLNSPAVSTQDRDRILAETFEGRALPMVVHFLRVLNKHGRFAHLAAIARQARTLWDRRENRRPVSVRSAVPLDDQQLAALRDRLARLTQAIPVIHLEVDPALIGGLVVQVGDDVYDGSVRNQIAQLRRSLIEGKTHEIQSRRDHFYNPA
jgi:F-type H+-transporting ATPase subunit delta